jgi:hypothetical protein
LTAWDQILSPLIGKAHSDGLGRSSVLVNVCYSSITQELSNQLIKAIIVHPRIPLLIDFKAIFTSEENTTREFMLCCYSMFDMTI